MELQTCIDKTKTMISMSHILLPTCNKAEDGEDVFLNVVKKVFSRSRYENNYLDNAFKMGLSGDGFSIEKEDLSMEWNQLSSDDQKSRQAKLLGYWSIVNFPSLGRQLWGQSWRAQAKTLQFDSDPIQMNAKAINEMMAKKIVLRVLHVNVSESTLGKLKYFVNVPKSIIATTNATKVTKTTTAFYIDDKWIEHCWKALKLGEFSLAFEQQSNLMEMFNLLSSLPNGEQTCGENASSSVAPKRASSVIENSSIGSSSIQAAKRACVVVENADVNDNANTNGKSNVNEKDNSNVIEKHNGNGRCTKDDSSIDYQAVILNIRDDIGRLTDMFQSTIPERDSGIASGQERLHIIVINQKDAEIAELRATVQELRQINDGLIKDQLTSEEEVEKQAALITVLRKGAEATLKLYEQSDRNSMENVNLIETMKRQLIDAATAKQTMEAELNAANRTKDKLRYDFNAFSEQSAGLVKEFHAQIDIANKKLIVSEKMNSDTMDQNTKLQEEIDALKRMIGSLETIEKSDVRTQKETGTFAEMKGTSTGDESIGSGIELSEMEWNENMQSVSINCSDVQGGDYNALHPQPIKETSGNGTIGGGIELSEVEWNNNEQSISINCSDVQGGDDSALHPQPIKETSEDGTIRSGIDLSEVEYSDRVSSDMFVTDDPNVQRCRDVFKDLQFAWIKFYHTRKAKYVPGFVYLGNSDGKRWAQRVNENGSINNEQKNFFHHAENVSDDLKAESGVSALQKFNKKFNLSYV